MQDAPRILVLGVGNLLWADEGFGVRCAEQLAAHWRFTPTIELLDGGTQGLALLPLFEHRTHVLILDACDFGAPPGTLVVARDAEIPAWTGSDKMSLHQAGMHDVLACLELLGRRPAHLTLIGAQPVNLDDYGGSLTPPVRGLLDVAVQRAVEELSRWGVECEPQAPAHTALLADALTLERYETRG